MQYTPARDDQGRILIAPTVTGMFVSDDDPADAPEAVAAPPAEPVPAPEPETPPAPRRPRSALDRQLRGDVALPTSPRVLGAYAALALLIVVLFYGLFGWTPAPAEPPAAQAAPTAIVVATPPPAPAQTDAPQVAVFWAPDGPSAGEVAVAAGEVLVVEQYRGWARLHSPHFSQDLWVRREALAGLGLGEQIAAAPEIPPTAAPAPPAPAVAAPAPAVHWQPAPLPQAAVAPQEQPAPPVLSEAGHVVVEDSPERYVVQEPVPPEATAVPTVMAPMGGGGGSWDD